LLHSSTERNYAQTVQLVHPVALIDPAGHGRLDHVAITRSRLLADSLHERIEVVNFGRAARDLRLRLSFEADFVDVFEVRGYRRERPAQPQPADLDRNSVTFACRGVDGTIRRTTIRLSPAPPTLSELAAEFVMSLAPGERAQIGLEVTPEVGDTPALRRGPREAREHLEREYAKWRKRCTRFRTANAQLTRFLDRAVLDLRMLLTTDDAGRRYLDAGIPWFSALFGRDSLITAYECLGTAPELSWSVLRGLATLQGTDDDPARDEEPGKIPHELRVGELAAAREIPQTPYYGSVDATPLWLVLLSYAYAWTGDLEAVRELWPNATAALAWIDGHGDLDGDGYVEYRRRAPRGLDNQGWKDSHDAIVHADGTPAVGPIALVEVQGYVYQAKRRLVRLARAVGDTEMAERLDTESRSLRERFNRDFWLEDQGYFAMALDGDKRAVATVTSNPGHGLWSGIIDRDKASRVARRLLSPALSSGWGIRTVADRQPAFDPLGYHTGTVWPHDTALIAHGLKSYGFDAECMQVLDQLLSAGAHFPMGRYPELFCGYASDDVPVPLEYPVACRPQAWSTGAPLLMLRSAGGLSADAPNGRLFVVRPRLPSWVSRVEVMGMRVGDARIDLTFTSQDGVTAVQVPRKEGDVDVLIRQ
jgi:glycogen debranching enzyme